MEQNNKVKVYTSSLGGNLEISVSGMKQTIEATNNRARYYAEQSLKYRDEAKMYAENAQYYADQNADVSKEDLFNLKLELQKEIAAKQDVGNYALKEELPINVSELRNDVNYVNDKQLLEKVPDQTGCTGQVLITNGEKTSWTGISSFQLFDCKLTDRILDDSETKGWALQGTYVYKDAIAGSRYGYPDFYAKCLEEYNEATDTETINGKTVKVHSNGHKFYDIADKTGIDEFFSTMGSAWFYGVDTENERIFLPRNNYYSLSLNKDSANVHSRTGSSVDVSTVEMMPYYSTSSGALVTGSDAGVVYPGIDGGGRIDRISNDDSGTHSSYTMGHSLYVDSADIVESNTDYYLYICVGNTEVTSTVTDVVEVTTTENDTLPLFSPMYFDFTPNNPSWLIGGGQANSGGIYATAYNELVNILNGETKYGDLKVIDVSNMVSGVDYSEYWQVDQDAMTFTTPTAISNKALSGAVIGNGMTLGLTNGTQFGGLTQVSIVQGSGLSGVVEAYGNNVGDYTGNTSMLQPRNVGVTTDSSKSGIVAEQSTAQLYFKVANAVQNLELLDAGEVLEAVNNIVPNNSSLIASYCMPSSKYIDLTLGASGTTYTAPANGYFTLGSIDSSTSPSQPYACLKNNSNGMITMSGWASTSSITAVFLPAKKGDTVTVIHDDITSFSNEIFRFIYAEGDK